MSIRDNLQVLYKRGEGRREFFDMLATYTYQRRELAVERAVENTGLAHETIITIFKDLEKAGVGRFIIGRRSKKTRIQWYFSPMSIGETAQGRDTSLAALSEDQKIAEESENEQSGDENELPGYAELLDAAKLALARELRLDPNRIDIQIAIRY